MSAAKQADLDWAAIGRMIRRERIKIGMNQSELGAAAGLDRKSISNYERGVGPARGDRVPDGYYKVGAIFGWTPDAVDSYLQGQQPPVESLAGSPAVGGPSPAELFPAVGRFARAAVQAGGDPALRDLLEDVADRLLQSIPREPAARKTSYGLAAYRPHGWVEGDVGVPDDDAARIRQALEEFEQGRQKP
ncbi:helix-turn-helix transcriptional regulator [Kitasatospora sp. NPDC005856]|uniref:helix-turn-helix domain-containing protein n=1 Tax=Kitasatospora sp. NPDC005856 TaxID=3154566 RepID=UPI003406BFC6